MNTIRMYRKKKNLTLKELGKIVGVAESTLSKYETGTNEPDLRTLTLIADALGVSVDVLLGRSGEQTAEEKSPTPRTPEARILASGIDKMPERDRERALNLVRLMFEQYADYFDREDTDDT